MKLYVVFDVETTGLNAARGDRVIEIGAVAVRGGCPVDEFHSLIRIPGKIPREVQCIHGITDEMLIGQPTPEEIFPRFYDFIRDSVLVAHNARFDIGFLKSELARQCISLNHRSVCTLKMSRQRFPELPNHRLSTVFRHIFGNRHGDLESHRALGDARRAAMIWMEMSRGT